MQDVKVLDHPNLVRDAAGYIKNADQEGFIAYQERREKIIAERKEHEEMRERVLKLEALVQQLIEGNKNG